jgi:hypothetical protein
MKANSPREIISVYPFRWLGPFFYSEREFGNRRRQWHDVSWSDSFIPRVANPIASYRARLPMFLSGSGVSNDRINKTRIVGLNHIALEVGDIEEALAFYGRIFQFELRGKSDATAFIDLGDQFIALQKGRNQSADAGRHFALVVDDKEAPGAPSTQPAYP